MRIQVTKTITRLTQIHTQFHTCVRVIFTFMCERKLELWEEINAEILN